MALSRTSRGVSIRQVNTVSNVFDLRGFDPETRVCEISTMFHFQFQMSSLANFDFFEVRASPRLSYPTLPYPTLSSPLLSSPLLSSPIRVPVW